MLRPIRTPAAVTFNGALLADHIEAHRQDADRMAALVARCDKYLAARPIAMTERRIKAPSGDIHDYASYGPYWWPDPTKPDGVPYIRRDGEFNPESRDPNNFDAFFTEVLTLAIGALYAPEGKDADYAARAVRDLRVFFLDEQTRVNPHMTYAQGIPGVCTGRGIGMIDSRNSWQLFDAIGILDAIGAMPEEVLSGVKRWFNAFLDWTLTSEIGADEDLQHNNHGTWFDVQVAATALFLGRRNLAKDRLMSAYDRRLAKHIMPDGRQPFELARTDAPGYSSMNLRAWTLLGKMAKRVGIKTDYFGQIPTGFNAPPLLCALEYLAPYGADVSDFPYQNIHGGAIDGLIAELSYLLAPEYPEAALKDRSEKPDPAFPGEEPSLDRLAGRYDKPEHFYRLLPAGA